MEDTKHTIIVRSDETKKRAVSIINSLKLDPPSEVTIKPFKVNRSLQQNSLYWEWLTVIAAKMHWTKEEVHENMKRRFLRVIYMRDDPGFMEMILAIRNAPEYISDTLKREVTRLMSTTTASVKQMSEYMTDIDHWAAEMGIRLPVPDDREE